TQCFYGGCNQTFHIGRIQGGVILDLDLHSAYAAMMGVIPVPDFSQVEHPRKPEELTSLISCALIKFTFPSDTRFPCIPVPTDHGLIYPLSYQKFDGVYATGPEIQAARRLGAKIEILPGHSYQVHTTDELLLAGYLQYLAAIRRQFKKGTPQNDAA